MNTRLLVPIARWFLFVVLIALTALASAPRARAATVTVSDCSAPGGAPGRLVEVVAAAAAGDTVVFSCNGTITLAATITIDKNLTLDGAGQSVAISGGNAVGVFTVNAGVTFNLQNLTVANGLVSSGAGVYNSGTLNVTNVTFSDNSASYGGGGIHSTGTLNVTNSAFSGNSGGYGGGIAIFNGTSAVTNSTFSGNSGGYGGGIANWNGTSTVMNSTFSGNSGTYGGGIANWFGCTLNVTNSTFSGNSGTHGGGGIYNSTGTVTVTNSTFSGNSTALGSGGGIHNVTGTVTVTNGTFSGNSAGAGGTGGIFGPVMLKNTIVANAPAGGNCSGTITNGGGNLQFGGTVANSCGATIPTADPVLSALADNGGPTQTMALGAGSAALDAGDDSVCAAAPVNNLDQRGATRPQGAHCDIGAFEQSGSIPPTSTPTPTSTATFTATATESPSPTPTSTATFTPTPTPTPPPAVSYVVNTLNDNTTGGDSWCTLREAIQSANNAGNGDCGVSSPADDTITFSVSGAIRLSSTLPNIVAGTGTLTIDGGGTVTISGDTNNDGTGDVRVFSVNAGANLTLQNLTVEKGRATGDGGGVSNSGVLTIANSAFSGNSASGVGGGVFNTAGGTLTITNSTFSGNSATSGGGIFGGGTITVTNSTFSGNNATQRGGGIYNFDRLTITNSTFSSNSAPQGGGGVYHDGTPSTITNSTFSSNSASSGGGVLNLSALHITNSAFSGNSATYGGGGVYNGVSVLTITNSAFSGNSAMYGGGVENNTNATATLTNSTFSGNSATNGGGVRNNTNATATIINSTFSGNSATNGGGGVYNLGVLLVENTIIANSISSRNCNGTLTDGGGNLQFGGTVADSCGAAIPTADPVLSALADNGGATQTMALLPDSPAINAANPANCPTTDQRGVGRGSACDIGAYEYLGVATGTVSSAMGGTIALADGTFTITFPPDAVTTTVTVTYTQALTPTQPLPTGRIGLRYFTLEARDGGGNLVTNFNQPYTLTLTYTDAELAAAHIDEGTFNLAFWNGAAWVDLLPCGGCGIDTVNNRVTIVANHFSDFALSGQTTRLFLPLIVR